MKEKMLPGKSPGFVGGNVTGSPSRGSFCPMRAEAPSQALKGQVTLFQRSVVTKWSNLIFAVTASCAQTF